MDLEKINEDLDDEKEDLNQNIEEEEDEKNVDDNENLNDVFINDNFNEDLDSDYDDILEDEEIDEHIVSKKKTFNFLTKYEKNYIMGIRINQIINGSPLFINYDNTKPFNVFEIVKEELYQKKLPFKVKRKLPNGNIEIWNLKDLVIF